MLQGSRIHCLKGVVVMTLRFSSYAFMDREQKCTLTTIAPLRIYFCTANDVVEPIICGALKLPFILEGEKGDAAIGGIFATNGKIRDFMYQQAVRLIEHNRANGLRTGIMPALSPKARPEHGALLLLVAYHPENEHIVGQQSCRDYKQILNEFFDGKPGFYC